MSRALLAIAAGLALAGCGAAPARPPLPLEVILSVSPDFSPAEVEAALAAVDEWRSVVPEAFTVRVAPCAGEDFEICLVPATYSPTGPGYTERNFTTGHMVSHVLSPMPDGYAVVQVMAHELGHSMGLNHEPRCLMEPGAPPAPAPGMLPQDADVAQWRAVHAHSL